MFLKTHTYAPSPTCLNKINLDLKPTDMPTNRDHLLIRDYLPTKFEASMATLSVLELSVVQGVGDRPTDVQKYVPPLLYVA